MKGQIFGLKAMLGCWGRVAPSQPLVMLCPRQEGRKAQPDTPGLIAAFIMLPKPQEQPALVPCAPTARFSVKLEAAQSQLACFPTASPCGTVTQVLENGWSPI